MTIYSDELSVEASRRSARWAEEKLKKRFSDVLGVVKGEARLKQIGERMQQNIKSDGRSSVLLEVVSAKD